MGIFDEAIREHLELKRQHGAGDDEVRELEDDAFGPAERPGAGSPAAEAPTTIAPAEAAEAVEQPLAEPAEPPSAPVEPLPESDQPVEPVEAVEEPVELPAEPPAVEEHPAMEHATVDPDAADAGTVAAETEEHPPPEPPEEPEAVEQPEEASIADQPTELHNLESEPGAEEAGQSVEPEAQEEGEEAVEDEFFSEQSLSDELDKALDAPETEGALPPPDVAEPAEPDSGEEKLPAEEEGGFEDTPPDEEEDVLEETPEFLQDTPEHDRLWFEQKPPKDFDFDD
jgi:hypothetical protein